MKAPNLAAAKLPVVTVCTGSISVEKLLNGIRVFKVLGQ